MDIRTGAVWMLRAVWFALPLTVGQAAGQAISSAGHAVPQVMTVGLWVFWSAGMVAAMVPLPLSLTALRVMAAAVLPLAVWSLIDTGEAVAGVGLAHAVILVATAFNSLIGDRYVDGGSYGDERRMLLRPPAQLGLIAAPAVWMLMVAGVATGPLLLANRNWILGVLASIIGFAIAVVGARSLHQLAQRWIVFVPTGMVLHDLMRLTDPVLFRRTAIERLGAAIAGTPAKDLSSRAPGLLLECELADPAPLGLRDADGATLTDVRRFLFCPSRPGELLDEATRRNIATD